MVRRKQTRKKAKSNKVVTKRNESIEVPVVENKTNLGGRQITFTTINDGVEKKIKSSSFVSKALLMKLPGLVEGYMQKAIKELIYKI
jgi:hypothetical protein